MDQLPEAAPVDQSPEAAPVEQLPEAAPVDQLPEAAPVDQLPEAAPVDQSPEAAPVEQLPEAAPVDQLPEALFFVPFTFLFTRSITAFTPSFTISAILISASTVSSVQASFVSFPSSRLISPPHSTLKMRMPSDSG